MDQACIKTAKPVHRSFNRMKLTAFPGNEKIAKCTSLDFSENPIDSLVGLEASDILTRLKINKTNIASFNGAKPQDKLLHLWITDTPLALHEKVHVMAVCVFGDKLKSIDGIMIKVADKKYAGQLRPKILEYLVTGWILTCVDPIMLVHSITRHRRRIWDESPVVSTQSVAENTNRRRVVCPNRSAFVKAKQCPRKEVTSVARAVSKDAASTGREAKPSTVKRRQRTSLPVSTSARSISSFTEIRDSKEVLIENSGMFPPIEPISGNACADGFAFENDDISVVADEDSYPDESETAYDAEPMYNDHVSPDTSPCNSSRKLSNGRENHDANAAQILSLVDKSDAYRTFTETSYEDTVKQLAPHFDHSFNDDSSVMSASTCNSIADYSYNQDMIERQQLLLMTVLGDACSDARSDVSDFERDLLVASRPAKATLVNKRTSVVKFAGTRPTRASVSVFKRSQ